MEELIRNKIAEWTQPPYDEDTIREISELSSRGDEKELTERFYRNLEFGTGGLRGIIGAGTNRMNIYTVGAATQGLANYISSRGLSSRGVVIAFDSRIKSDVFSRKTAEVMAAHGIKVYIFDDVTPVPLCSFAVRELNATAGVVITASHNPPEYNGYKVYWDDGAQVVSPQDTEIISEVNKIDSIDKIKSMPYNDGIARGIITVIGDDIRNSYIKNLEQYALREKKTSPVKIVYSPLHGTGYRIVPKVLSHFGFTDISIVKAQEQPDGTFPTVKSPNPEERAAMTMSLELAREVQADIVLATDPDSDRMGVAFKDDNGEYILINGNQIGTMLEYYILKRKSGEGTLPDNGAVVKTIVTTELQADIARSFNCRIEDVLTGFKWIALKMKEYDESGSAQFVFGGEESYGYLPVPFVRDKDAVSSCYFFAEMTDWLKSSGQSLNDFLNEIYSKYGMYLEDLHSLTLKGKEGMEQIGGIMAGFRKNPPVEFSGTKVEKIADIQSLMIKDLTRGTEESIPGLPKSNVLQYFLADGTKITMRPSGTEPKIKFYFSVRETVAEESTDTVKAALQKKIASLKEDLLAKVGAV
ncbi:MAG TPA: phospho-sugar mutase [Spirochaetota bacterium]|nr:phospho-sugar mutase [Spirochaetota bacterium]